MLLGKKRYAGLYWTSDEKYDKLDTKGIETVRRDNCRLVGKVMDTALKKILIERSKEKAIAFVHEQLALLLQNKIDMSYLIISKSLGKGGEASDYHGRQAHVELMLKMRWRNPWTAPQGGDRVPYVIVKSHKTAKNFEKSEDPIYALENNIPIDAQWYIDHQLESPLLRIFGPIMYSAEKGETEQDGAHRARKALFTGDHMKNVVEVTSTWKLGANFGANTSNMARCIGCKVKINKVALPSNSNANQNKAQVGGSSSSSVGGDVENGTRLREMMTEAEYKKKFWAVDLCAHCLKEKGPEIYFERVQEVRKKQVEFRKLWTECQRCQDTIHQLIQCTNSDCPIFYRRQKVRIEMEKVESQLKNLQIEW